MRNFCFFVSHFFDSPLHWFSLLALTFLSYISNPSQAVESRKTCYQVFEQVKTIDDQLLVETRDNHFPSMTVLLSEFFDSLSENWTEDPPYPYAPTVDFEPSSEAYKVRNKNADEQPISSAAEVTVRFNQPRWIYFSSQSYNSLNANQSVFKDSPSQKPKPILFLPSVLTTSMSPAHQGKDQPLKNNILTVYPMHLKDRTGYLPIPVGFDVRSYSGKGLKLEIRNNGVFYQKNFDLTESSPKDTDPSVHLELLPSSEKILTTEEKNFLNQVEQAPSLIEYPDSWQDFINDLRIKKQKGLIDDLEIAELVTTFIKENFIYEMDERFDEGVIDFCRKKRVQCDGASLVLITVLRSFFHIPCYAAGGFQSVQDENDPEASVISDQATPHLFTMVYDSENKKFTVFDPTPEKKSRERKNNNDQSPTQSRFKNWPRSSPSSSSPPASSSSPPTKDSNNKENPKALTLELEEKIAQMWRQLFTLESNPKWRNQLINIDQELQLAQDQSEGLAPHLTIMKNNINYLQKILKFLPAESLKKMVLSLSSNSSKNSNRTGHRKEEKNDTDNPQELKINYLKLQTLFHVSAYGLLYSENLEKRKAYEKIHQWLTTFFSQFPPAKTKVTKIDDLLQDLPGSLAKESLLAFPQKFSIFQQMAQLSRKVKLNTLPQHSLQPSVSYRWLFHRDTSEEMDYFPAEGFEDIEFFERGGLGRKYDRFRVFSDEMPTRKWLVEEPIKLFSQRKEGVNAISFILFDLSGSMAQHKKGIVRDRLIQMWVDELKEEKIILIGYRMWPEKTFIIDSHEKARRQFTSMLMKEEFFISSGGNDFSRAFNLLIQILNDKKPEEDSYEKINVRVITDGEETFNLSQLRKLRDNLNEDTEINMTAVTLREGNPILESFIRDSSLSQLLNGSVYIHLTDSDIQSITENTDPAHESLLNSLLPSNYRELSRLPHEKRISLEKLSEEL